MEVRKLICDTNCPEIEGRGYGHCKCDSPEEMYSRYPDGCPCGNEIRLIDNPCYYCLCKEVCANSMKDRRGCSLFKDSRQYLKIPCKIGDRIFKISWYTKTSRRKGDKGFINEYIVVGAHLKDERSRRNIPREEYIVVRSIGYGYSSHISFSQIGVTAFFDLEEAKIKLKEGPGK